MKKRILLAPALLMGLSLSTILPTGAFADDLETTVVNDGIVLNNRTLVPVRVISEELGSKVEWNQKSKTVTVTDGKNKKVMKANSKTITVNGKSQKIDSPVTIKDGKTYVPLVVASPEGVKVKWDNQSKVATLTSDDKQVVVMTNKKAFQETELTEDRIQSLIAKADEISKMPFIDQKRLYFKDYFTNAWINMIIGGNGVLNEHAKDFKGLTEYTSRLNAVDNNIIIVEQVLLNHHDNRDLTKSITLKKEDGAWKVDWVSYSVSEQKF